MRRWLCRLFGGHILDPDPGDFVLRCIRCGHMTDLYLSGVTCRHCGARGLPGEDHSCPCPFSDKECPGHG